MTGPAVRWTQTRLSDLGYLSVDAASGDFDGATGEAVRRFQIAYGLPETGEVGPETLVALYQALGYATPRLGSGEEHS